MFSLTPQQFISLNICRIHKRQIIKSNLWVNSPARLLLPLGVVYSAYTYTVRKVIFGHSELINVLQTVLTIDYSR